MNDDRLSADDRLITTVRESLAEFEMTTPEDQIISRGHAARAVGGSAWLPSVRSARICGLRYCRARGRRSG